MGTMKYIIIACVLAVALTLATAEPDPKREKISERRRLRLRCAARLRCLRCVNTRRCRRFIRCYRTGKTFYFIRRRRCFRAPLSIYTSCIKRIITRFLRRCFIKARYNRTKQGRCYKLAKIIKGRPNCICNRYARRVYVSRVKRTLFYCQRKCLKIYARRVQMACKRRCLLTSLRNLARSFCRRNLLYSAFYYRRLFCRPEVKCHCSRRCKSIRCRNIF